MTQVTGNLEARLGEAVKHFWTVRELQAVKQGASEPVAKDRGERGAVTGGKQLDGFVRLVYDLLVESGLSGATIFCQARPEGEVQVRKKKRDPNDPPICTRTELPGWFRAEKDWDLLVVVEKCLIAAIEFKSQVGPSFGNNFNNRTEEAIGNALDLWAAYREGSFKPSQRPWLGYLMLLEEAPGSMTNVRVAEPHFHVFEEFRDASYAKRYEILLTKLVRERLYDAACFLIASKEGGQLGQYREPSEELGFKTFVRSLLAQAMAVAQTQPPSQQPKLPVIEYEDQVADQESAEGES